MGLYRNMLEEPVRVLELREPVLGNADETVRDAILKMRQQELGCIIVVDEENRPVGIFTEGMLNQQILQNPNVVNEPLRSHVAQQWQSVKLTDPIIRVLDAMQTEDVRFVCVVDQDGRVAGLTGQKGLMEYVADHFPGHVMVQRIGGAPFTQEREGA